MISIENIPHAEGCECVICKPMKLEALEYTRRTQANDSRFVVREIFRADHGPWFAVCEFYFNGVLQDEERIIRFSRFNANVRDCHASEEGRTS